MSHYAALAHGLDPEGKEVFFSLPRSTTLWKSEWHNRKVVTFLSGVRNGRVVWVGGASRLYPVNHENADQPRESVRPGTRRRADGAFSPSALYVAVTQQFEKSHVTSRASWSDQSGRGSGKRARSLGTEERMFFLQWMWALVKKKCTSM